MEQQFRTLNVLSFIFSGLGAFAAAVTAFNALRMVAAADSYWFTVYASAFVGGLLLLAVGEFFRMAVAVANNLVAPTRLPDRRPAPSSSAPAPQP